MANKDDSCEFFFALPVLLCLHHLEFGDFCSQPSAKILDALRELAACVENRIDEGMYRGGWPEGRRERVLQAGGIITARI